MKLIQWSEPVECKHAFLGGQAVVKKRTRIFVRLTVVFVLFFLFASGFSAYFNALGNLWWRNLWIGVCILAGLPFAIICVAPLIMLHLPSGVYLRKDGVVRYTGLTVQLWRWEKIQFFSIKALEVDGKVLKVVSLNGGTWFNSGAIGLPDNAPIDKICDRFAQHKIEFRGFEFTR